MGIRNLKIMLPSAIGHLTLSTSRQVTVNDLAIATKSTPSGTSSARLPAQKWQAKPPVGLVDLGCLQPCSNIAPLVLHTE